MCTKLQTGELSVEINASEAVDRPIRFNRPVVGIARQEEPFLKSD
jgi:hypothetical protein